MVKNAVLTNCSSLSALTYSGLAEVQKFITLRPFVVSGNVNSRWKFSTFGLFMLLPDSGRKDTKIGKLCWLYGSARVYRCFSLLLNCHIYHYLSLL
jgi:hypothetical protein